MREICFLHSRHCQPLTTTRSHLQPLAATPRHSQPHAATCSHSQPLEWPQVAASDRCGQVAASGRFRQVAASGRKWPLFPISNSTPNATPLKILKNAHILVMFMVKSLNLRPRKGHHLPWKKWYQMFWNNCWPYSLQCYMIFFKFGGILRCYTPAVFRWCSHGSRCFQRNRPCWCQRWKLGVSTVDFGLPSRKVRTHSNVDEFEKREIPNCWK